MSEEEKKEIRKEADPQWLLFLDRIMDSIDMVLKQFTSGRWLLTIAAGVCLIHFAWTLPPERQDKIIDLIKDIIIFYFVVNKAVETVTKGANNVASNQEVLPKPIQPTEPPKV